RSSYDTSVNIAKSNDGNAELARTSGTPMLGRQPRSVVQPRERRRGMRHVLLHTWPGRAIVIGLAARIVVYAIEAALGTVPTVLSVINTIAGVALAGGATYFVYQVLVIAKRRLLWRVRRKLILSYFFIGFVPALLIVAFFLLSGFLLMYNFSSYLVQSRLRALSDRVKSIAEGTAIEAEGAGGRDIRAVVDRRQSGAVSEFPLLSIAVVPVGRSCAETSPASAPVRPRGETIAAGPWRHVS